MASSTAYKNKDVIIFDLDGTLTESKSDLSPDMARAIAALLARKKVAIIGGGAYRQFRKQFIVKLDIPRSLLSNLYLFPTTAMLMYQYRSGWKKSYEFKLSKSEKQSIRKAFKEVLRDIEYIPPAKTYGKVLEDRGTQFTFSALGQDIVAVLGAEGVVQKKKWLQEHPKLKNRIADLLQKKLPKLEVHPGGISSVDVTKKGIDKAYGVRQVEKHLKTPIFRMVFIGDALYKGGNDAAAKKSGIDTIAVRGPEDTKKVIEKLLKE